MMDYKGKIVIWNRKTTPGYYGVIVDTEMRECGAPLPPWRWFKIKFTTPIPPEFTEEWHRCDHINIVDGYTEISKIHAAMTESERIKGAL
jgi:hypothetical protein